MGEVSRSRVGDQCAVRELGCRVEKLGPQRRAFLAPEAVMGAPTGSMATEAAQRHAAAMMAACAAGRCRYSDPHRTRQQCEAAGIAATDDMCDGYQAHVYIEDG